MTELQRILHVDDDEDIRSIADIALKLVGQFDLLQCASGKKATEKAEVFRPAKPFDPMELANQLRALWQNYTGL